MLFVHTRCALGTVAQACVTTIARPQHDDVNVATDSWDKYGISVGLQKRRRARDGRFPTAARHATGLGTAHASSFNPRADEECRPDARNVGPTQ